MRVMFLVLALSFAKVSGCGSKATIDDFGNASPDCFALAPELVPLPSEYMKCLPWWHRHPSGHHLLNSMATTELPALMCRGPFSRNHAAHPMPSNSAVNVAGIHQGAAR